MKKILLIIGIAFLLSACGYRGLIAQRGAEAADAQLETSEWGFCQAPTMGAYMRRFDGYPEEREAYSKLCWPGSETPAPPEQ